MILNEKTEIAFFSLAIYTPKVAKRKHIQQCPTTYLVLSGGN